MQALLAPDKLKRPPSTAQADDPWRRATESDPH
jgi:hypothetical protein